MADKPILFSGPMVRAILDGRKTQTRRVTKRQDDIHVDGKGGWLYPRLLPYAVGDRLWVREAHAWPNAWDEGRCELARIWYPAGTIGRGRVYEEPKLQGYGKTRPSIHMPRWASRLTLIVEDVRVQRLQEISAEDAKAEGVLDQVNTHTGPLINCYGPDCPVDDARSCNKHGCWGIREDFKNLWDGLNAARGFGWDTNPWVIAVTFRTFRANIDSEEVRNG